MAPHAGAVQMKKAERGGAGRLPVFCLRMSGNAAWQRPEQGVRYADRRRRSARAPRPVAKSSIVAGSGMGLMAHVAPVAPTQISPFRLVTPARVWLPSQFERTTFDRVRGLRPSDTPMKFTVASVKDVPSEAARLAKVADRVGDEEQIERAAGEAATEIQRDQPILMPGSFRKLTPERKELLNPRVSEKPPVGSVRLKPLTTMSTAALAADADRLSRRADADDRLRLCLREESGRGKRRQSQPLKCPMDRFHNRSPRKRMNSDSARLSCRRAAAVAAAPRQGLPGAHHGGVSLSWQ